MSDTSDTLRNRAAFFRNPDYTKRGFPGHLIEPLAAELEAAAAELEQKSAIESAARSLLFEVKGMLGIERHAIAELISETNMQRLERRAEQLEKALPTGDSDDG